MECAKLILNSSYLTAGSTNKYGYASSFRTQLVFNNISFKSIVGKEIYNKYDKFNLVLRNITTSVGATALGGKDSQSPIMYLSGLDFVNSTYRQLTKTNVSEVELGIMLYQQSNVSTIIYDSHRIVTFRKPLDNIFNLKIEFRRLDNDALISGSFAFPDVMFFFDIIPVE